MSKRNPASTLCHLAFALACLACAGFAGAAESRAGVIDPSLRRALAIIEETRVPAFHLPALLEREVPQASPWVTQDGFVMVVVEHKPEVSARLILGRIKHRELTTTPRAFKAVVAPAVVPVLARQKGVTRVRFPSKGVVRQGSRLTMGLELLNARILRDVGARGLGVRVGVISDGIRDIQLAKDSGDLPQNVTVMPHTACNTCAEGNAMLEIVHDIAPQAELAFCGGLIDIEFMACVRSLREDFGADIIVDDLGFYAEPFFEDDGPIATEVQAIVDTGALYVSAAGNDADNHVSGVFTPTQEFIGNLPGLRTVHDFGLAAGGESDTRLNFTIPGEESIFARRRGFIVLQWDDRFGESANDLDLNISNSETSPNNNSQDGVGGDDFPVEIFPIGQGEFDQFFSIRIERKIETVNPDPAREPRLKLYIIGVPIQDLEYANPASTIFGHPAAAGALAVAAIDSRNPGLVNIQPFSSRGPYQFRFPQEGGRLKPDITAVDCVDVTGSGFFPTTFCGTSAAAPHVAGILAQLVGNFSGDHKASILNAAIDKGVLDEDVIFGFGLIDAFEAGRQMNQVPLSRIISPRGPVVQGDVPTDFQADCGDPERLGGTTHAWQLGGDLGTSTQEDPGLLTYDSNTAFDGVFRITYACTDVYGVRANNDEVMIRVNAQPESDIDVVYKGQEFEGENEITIDIGDTLNFDADCEDLEQTRPPGSPGQGPFTYRWTFTGTSPETSGEENPVRSYAQAGNFLATLVCEDVDGGVSPATSFLVMVRQAGGGGGGTQDTVPDPFVFQDTVNVATGSLQTSNEIVITGIDAPAPISIQGGDYSINGGAFGNDDDFVANGARLRVRHTASTRNGVRTDTVLTVGTISDTFSSTTGRAQDTTPDPFMFNDQQNVPTGSVQTSNTVTIAGLEAGVSAAVTVSGGGGSSYSKNGGVFTTSPGTVVNGNTLAVRHTASGSNNAATNTTLTVGGVSDTFTSVTVAPGLSIPGITPADTTPEPFRFNDQTNVERSTERTSNSVTITGIAAAASISVTGGQYSINGGAFTSANGSITNGQTVRVRHTSSADFETVVSTTLTVGGVSDTFQSQTLAPPEAMGNSVTILDLNGDPVVFTTNVGSFRDAMLVPQAGLGVTPSTTFEYRNGFFAFRIVGVAPGGSAIVTVDLPAAARPTAYVKCNTVACQTLGANQVTINLNRVVLRLNDGDVLDTDPAAGVIGDPGAPAVAANNNGGGGGGGGGGGNDPGNGGGGGNTGGGSSRRGGGGSFDFLLLGLMFATGLAMRRRRV